jgi:predicted nucleic acid-binding protein
MAILPAGLSADAPGSIRPVPAAPTARLWARRRRIFDEILCRLCDYLLDSSALVKRHVREPGSAWVRALTRPRAAHILYLSHITAVEVFAAITRRQRGGSLSPAQAGAILGHFRRHLASRYRILEITIPLLGEAMLLARSHGLRAYDAVQLASVLEAHRSFQARRSGPLTLVSADLELNAAATAEGLSVEDPNSHP